MSDIIEILQILNNPDNLKVDINNVVAMIGKHFKQKYLSPMNNLYTDRCMICKENPSSEVTLLQAIKPFVNNKENIDALINGLNSYNAITGIMSDYSNTIVTAQSEGTDFNDDSCVHTDGIYEIDTDCIKSHMHNNTAAGNDISLLLLVLAFIISNRH